MSASTTKRPVKGVMVKLLFQKNMNRGMKLLNFETRCIQSGELHELACTDRKDVKLGDTLDRVGYLGFVDFQSNT